MRLAILTVLTLALAACSSNVNTLPDAMQTGQLLVAYQPETQVVRLTEGACDGEPEADAIATAMQDATGRLYYGLEPGAYCLTWGQSFSAGWLATGQLDLTVSAGAMDFVSVIPPQLVTQ